MTRPPDASVLRAFLARASRRLAWMSAAEGAAAGLAIAVASVVVQGPHAGAPLSSIAMGISLALAGVVVRLLWSSGQRRRVAHLVEQRAPQSRNLIVTANELGAHRGVAEHIAALVYAQAARLVSGLDLAALFPARNAVVSLAAVGAVWTFAVARSGAPRLAAPASRTAASDAIIDYIVVEVTPPAYSARPPQSFRDPARVDALAGSRIRVRVHSPADSIAVETLSARLSLRSRAGQFFSTDLLAEGDGYVAVEPYAANGRVGVRRLIGLSVTPDTPPRVRITAPGKDLFLRDARRTIDVAVEAGDDIGLASLRLRYTKVSGSGERFTFTEGELPIEITRTDARAWTARAKWNLETLGLLPGDMVVYRAAAADHRPGAAPSESDSYIAEILAPGGDAAAGFAVDPEQERYAVSQQMVIVKTERLAARKSQMSADDYATASAELAAEQRKVRAEFVFMMGGELADAPDAAASMTDINEQAEAAGEDDLLAGRNANQGRVALLRAIRAMSRAATSLNTADLPTALPHERAALAQLERAFSHTRIILRALTERERLDLSRRLTGVLTDAARDARPAVEAGQDPRVTDLRRALSGIATLAGTRAFDASASASASALAERVLRVDPSAKPLQDISALLTQAAAAIGHGRADEARRALDSAATGIAAALRADLLDAPRRASAMDLDRLGGALTDALRRQRGSR